MTYSCVSAPGQLDEYFTPSPTTAVGQFPLNSQPHVEVPECCLQQNVEDGPSVSQITDCLSVCFKSLMFHTVFMQILCRLNGGGLTSCWIHRFAYFVPLVGMTFPLILLFRGSQKSVP